MIGTFLQGLGTGGGLIIAIGAQNAFVLSQSVKGNHHLLIAFICILCDAIFITLGVAGLGQAVSSNPELANFAAFGGAIFLFLYGCRAIYSVVKGGSMDTGKLVANSWKTAVIATLAVTLLNPHFYLDTVVLLGSISSKFQGDHRYFFLAGAISASILWYSSLSIGGRALAPLFKKKISWKILDTLVCITMWSIAFSLLIK